MWGNNQVSQLARSEGTLQAVPNGGACDREPWWASAQLYQLDRMGSMPSWAIQSTGSAKRDGARAGHAAGGWVGRPRCARIFWMAVGLSNTATRHRLPLQRSQVSTSKAKTRRSSVAQGSR